MNDGQQRGKEKKINGCQGSKAAFMVELPFRFSFLECGKGEIDLNLFNQNNGNKNFLHSKLVIKVLVLGFY